MGLFGVCLKGSDGVFIEDLDGNVYLDCIMFKDAYHGTTWLSNTASDFFLPRSRDFFRF
jgi:4-aminobutyrate aminotransferase-like enzyme